ncbi:MAG TPA: sulfite reductase subunit alpha, partial [Candidatus Acidoferrum sp.]|nr:sulfite reductase subunit alpha [Candidatus Acidoferrum sp.]
ANQRAWLNGYFAGLTSFDVVGGANNGVPSAVIAAKKSLLVLFGSQSGTAEGFAKKFAKRANTGAFTAKVAEANVCSLEELATAERLLLITSTWGDGDAPDNAAQLLSNLSAADALKFDKLTFAVLALGDKNYPDFCGAGRRFDIALEQRGAKRLLPRVDCDLDYESAASEWSERVLSALGEQEVISETVNSNQPSLITDSLITDHSRKNPFPARLIENRLLTSSGSGKEVRHVAISLEGSGLNYEVGDALGIVPSNCSALVSDIIAALGCDGEEAVKAPDDSETSLRNALLRYYVVTQPSTSLLEAVAERAQCAELKHFIAPENKAALEKHLHGRDVLDFLLAHPLARFTPSEFVALLRKLNPRLYSIASSSKAHPGEVHLCVGVVRFDCHGRTRKGVCSTFLADRVDGETPVPVFTQVSHGFRLPGASDTPIIMVGPGTGIAPFRAFLEERRTVGAKGKNWLLFGDQKRATDFLYREELESMFNDGVLTRLDLAFSRDQAEKIYVQHRMLEHAAELFGWLEQGAHFYVCGDAKRMAKDVDAALHEVVQRVGGKTAEQAAEYVAALKSAKRYQRDVY